MTESEVAAKILDLLSAGGNVATMALLWVMWRFDRRLMVLEWHIFDRRQRRERKDEGGA